MPDIHDGDLPLNRMVKRSKGKSKGSNHGLDRINILFTQDEREDHMAQFKMEKRTRPTVGGLSSSKKMAWLVDCLAVSKAGPSPHLAYQSNCAVNTPCLLWQRGKHSFGETENSRWGNSQYKGGNSEERSPCSSMRSISQSLRYQATHNPSYFIHDLDRVDSFGVDKGQSPFKNVDATNQANMQSAKYRKEKTVRKSLANILSAWFDKLRNADENDNFHPQNSAGQGALQVSYTARSGNKAFGRDSLDPIWTKFEDFCLPFSLLRKRIETRLCMNSNEERPSKTGQAVDVFRSQTTQHKKRKRRKKPKLLFSRPSKRIHASLAYSRRLPAKACNGKHSLLVQGRKSREQAFRKHIMPRHIMTRSKISHATTSESSIDNGSSRETAELSEFRCKLESVCQAPFDITQLAQLMQLVEDRKPIERLRNTRQGSVFFSTEKEGLSYLDHHPDLAKKLESTSNPEEKLRLLRGFIFWIQHACMPGSYKPWTRMLQQEEDDDCVEIEAPDCEVAAVVVSL